MPHHGAAEQLGFDMPIPEVRTNIANGVPAQVPDDIASTCAIIGASSSGVLTTKNFSRRADAIDEFVEGPLVRGAVHCIDTAKRAVLLQRCEASNPGEYGDIDVTGFTGAAVPSAKGGTVPLNEYELYVEFVEGGDVGVTGDISYYTSTENGRIALSGLTRLGAATEIAFSGTGCTIVLDPPLAELLTFVNELVDEFEDHIALTSGGVHGAADAGPYTIGATAIDQAGAILRFNQALTAAKLHVVKTSSSIHGAADSVGLSELNAITVPTSGQTLVTAAIAFKDAFFGDGVTVNSGHTLRTVSSIHGAVDATNVIVADEPTRGTVAAGDVIRLPTAAPYPSTVELAAAFSALALSDYTPGFVLLPGRTPASYAPTITAGLDLMRANGKPCRCIVQARAISEIDSDIEGLRDNLETETAAVADTRILWASTDALCTTSEGSTVVVPAERLTGFAINLASYRITLPFWTTTWQVGKGQLPGVRLVDNDGVLIGWDEPKQRATRLQMLYRVPSALLGRPTVAAPDYTLAGTAERLKTFYAGLIEDEIVRVVEAYHWEQIGITQRIVVTSPGFGKFKTDALRQALERSAAARLQARPGLQQGVTDIDESDLVYLDPQVTIDQGLIYLAFYVNWTPVLPVGRITTTIAVRVGA